MITTNALGDGEGIISDCNKNFHLSSIKSSQEIIFLFLHVMGMLESIVAMLENIETTLGDRYGWLMGDLR